MSALDGLRVIELCQVMAGPFCGQVLADMGADVIKVEPPEVGDQTRRSMGEAAFRAVNRNKRSIALNLKDPADVAVLHELVRTADVLTENYRPGVADRLGAGWEALRAINPRLIYASISGFGQTGPYAQRPGFDLIAQGAAGVMSVTGEPGGNPVKCGVPVSDLSAGLFCAVGILSALAARERTGEGQRVDTSLWEGALALSIWETAELWSTGNGAATARVGTPADRAVSGAAHPRRVRERRRQQPEAVGAAVRGDRATGADRGVPDQRGPDGAAAGARGRIGSRAGGARHGRVGRRLPRGRRPRRPDPRLRPGRRGPAHPARVRWWSRWSIPKRARSTDSASRSS